MWKKFLKYSLAVIVGFSLGTIGKAIPDIITAYVISKYIKPAEERRAKERAIESFKEKRKLFKGAVLKELERNVRVLQFYICCLQDSWKGNIYIDVGLSPVCQNVLVGIPDSDIYIFADIQNTYEDYNRAKEIIGKINERKRHEHSRSNVYT